jgi:hypothetical protein
LAIYYLINFISDTDKLKCKKDKFIIAIGKGLSKEGGYALKKHVT